MTISPRLSLVALLVSSGVLARIIGRGAYWWEIAGMTVITLANYAVVDHYLTKRKS